MAAAVRADGRCPGDHYLRLDVLDRNGGVIRYLARETMARCGQAEFEIDTAFNDPHGRWTIVVADVATGVQGQLQIDMGARVAVVPQPEPFLIPGVDD